MLWFFFWDVVAILIQIRLCLPSLPSLWTLSFNRVHHKIRQLESSCLAPRVSAIEEQGSSMYILYIFKKKKKKKKPSGALPSRGYFLGMNLYLFSPTSEQVCKKGRVPCRYTAGLRGWGWVLFPGTELVPLFPTSEQVCKKGQGATSVHCRPWGVGVISWD